MGYNISQLKLQYYPTDRRICDYFTYLHLPIYNVLESEYNAYKHMKNNRTIELNEYYDSMKALPQFKFKKDWFKIPTYSTYHFQKDVIENNNPDYNSFKFKRDYYSNEISINDYFCGQGEWLINYKKYESVTYPIKTLGIELEEQRADISKANGINYIFNSAYEDVELPSNSVSILCFNPPYFNESNTERATKRYLQEIIDNKTLIECSSWIDFVIREDDFIDCLDILLDHFVIESQTIAKAPSDEFSKFKQIVFTAKFNKYWKPSLDTKYLINYRQNEKQKYINILQDVKEIDVTNISQEVLNHCRELTYIKFDEMIKLIQVKNNSKNKISNNKDLAWNWFKELTQTNLETKTTLTMPKEPKQGEIINIISSGFINGQIDNHVISGGTRQVEETIKSLQMNDKGQEHEVIEVRRINKPFLNVLLPNGSIKKLLNKDVE